MFQMQDFDVLIGYPELSRLYTTSVCKCPKNSCLCFLVKAERIGPLCPTGIISRNISTKCLMLEEI